MNKKTVPQSNNHRKKICLLSRESGNHEDLSKAIMETVSDTVVVLNKDGTIRYKSPDFDRMVGGKRANKNLLEFVHPDDAEIAAETFSHLIQNPGSTVQVEIRGQHRDGSWKVFQVTGKNMLDNPAITGIITSFQDISERKQAEDKLQQKTHDLNERVKELGCLYGISNLAGKYDTSLEEILQGTAELASQAWQYPEITCVRITLGSQQFKTHNFRETAWKQASDIVAHGELTGTLEICYLEEKPESDDGPFLKEERDLLNVIAERLGRIIERKQAEEALRESEERFRQIFNGVNDEIIYVDTDGVVINVNEKIRDISGYSPDEMIGRNVLELNLFDPDELSKLSELMMASKEQGGAQRPLLEVQARHRDGHMVPLEVSTSLMAAADGTPEGYISIIRDITERRRMEGELLVKENAIENSINAMAISDIQGNITYVNQACLTLWRKNSKEELLGKSFWELLELEDAAVAQDIARAMIENGSWKGDLTARRKDGSEINVQVLTTLIKDEKGNPVKTMSSFIDVTERTRAEEALRASENKLRAMFETMSDGIAVTDIFGNIAEANDALIRLHGYSQKGELIWKRALDVVAEKDRAKAAEDIGKAIGEGDTALAKYALMTKDGGEVEVEASASLLRDGSGNPAGLVAVMRDITERKKIERELQESEERFRTLTETASDAILTVNTSGEFTTWNLAAEQIFGYTAAEAIGKSLEIIIPENSRQYFHEAFNSFDLHPQSASKQHPMEVMGLRKDGSEFPAEITMTTWEAGQNVYFTAIVRDITDRKKIEQQLQLISRLASVGELAAGVAHELNNPLAAIHGYAELLTERQDLDSRTKTDIETIFKEAQRAARITSNLLSFARKHIPQKTLSSMNEVLEKTLEMYAYRLKVSNIEVLKELDPNLPLTMFDQPQFEQVFVNVLNNAEQAMLEAKGRGTLQVKTEVVKDTIRVSFSDDGPGIPQEVLERVFDPFFTTKEVGKGTGLGLSICYGIVREHGGNIHIESTQGQGTTVTIEIPAVNESYLVDTDAS